MPMDILKTSCALEKPVQEASACIADGKYGAFATVLIPVRAGLFSETEAAERQEWVASERN